MKILNLYVYVLQLNIINAIKIFDVFLTMLVYKNEEFQGKELNIFDRAGSKEIGLTIFNN